MADDDLVGFWCYTRDDNSQDDERITSLASALADEFRMITGRSLKIFVDRDDIQWGQEWRTRIAEALDTTTFFFPIITPRFFHSAECRRELLQFVGQAGSLGIGDLIMPLIYVKVSDLTDTSPDEAKALVSRMQFVDICDLRFVKTGSVEYRQKVNELAEKLAAVSLRISETPETTPAEIAAGITPLGGPVDMGDEEKGFLDLVADFEENFPQLGSTVEAFSPLMQEMAAIAADASEKMKRGNEEGKPFAFKIVVAREMANRLAEPAKNILELGESYASQLISVDPGMRALIRAADEGEKTPEEIAAACQFFASARELVSASRESSETLRGLTASLDTTARLSRDLRPVFRQIRTGLQGMVDGQGIIEEWERLMDASQLDCHQ